MRILIILLLLAAACYCIYLFFKSIEVKPSDTPFTGTKASGQNPEEKPIEPAQPTAESRLNDLIALGLSLRASSVSDGTFRKFHDICNSLLAILPEAEERFPGKSTTESLNRVIDSHLPKIITPFTQLNAEQKLTADATLGDTFEKIFIKLQETKEILDDNNELAYLSKSTFLDDLYRQSI
jgi:hypothetical protein